MKVFFSDRAYAAILAETTEKIKTETGGLFLGVVDRDQWYVIETIDPGPKAVFEVAYFEYDQTYTEHLINKIANLYQEKLELIGLWHRHPGSFDQFSSTDDGTNTAYAKMRQEGAISALVNIDPSFRLTIYHVGQPCKYKTISYEVGDCYIPDNLLKFKSSETYFSIMDRVRGKSHDNVEGFRSTMSFSDFLKCVIPYCPKTDVDHDCDDSVSEDLCIEKILDSIVEDVTYLSELHGITLTITQSGPCICLTNSKSESQPKLYFRYLSDKDVVCFSYQNDCFKYEKNAFKKSFELAVNQTQNNRSNGITQQRAISDAFRRLLKL